jgi:hypothetical protein
VAPGLPEARALWWRERTDERILRRDARRWTTWTVAISVPAFAAGLLLLWLEPWTFPAALLSFAHGVAIPMLNARRGARSVVPVGDRRGASGEPAVAGTAQTRALGMLGDLVSHEARATLTGSGLVVERGRLGVWVVGEQGAILVRPGGRRAFCWCVRVGEPGRLPGADRVAALLLALREDEAGLATVANLAFSGAPWRVRPFLAESARPALDAALAAARA